MNLPQTSSAAKTALTSATKSYPGFTPSFVAEREPANEASTNLPTAAAEREQAQPASPNVPTAAVKPSNHVAERESANDVSPNLTTAALEPLTTTTTDTDTEAASISITKAASTDTKARSISTAMRPGTQEPPPNVTKHGTDVSNKDQVHSSWSRFSQKLRDLVTGTELHDKVDRKKAKKAKKQHEMVQKQHEKLQAQRAASLKQLAQSGWNVKDVRSTEKGN